MLLLNQSRFEGKDYEKDDEETFFKREKRKANKKPYIPTRMASGCVCRLESEMKKKVPVKMRTKLPATQNQTSLSRVSFYWIEICIILDSLCQQLLSIGVFPFPHFQVL